MSRYEEAGVNIKKGEEAVERIKAHLRSTFVPGVGMTGVSLRYERREYLALPGGVAALRVGHTGGLPLLAPWANRLGSRRFVAPTHSHKVILDRDRLFPKNGPTRIFCEKAE
jgi:phosphoribosylaminoimidazole (AIR) synthetase